jgi:hypothetical protein
LTLVNEIRIFTTSPAFSPATFTRCYGIWVMAAKTFSFTLAPQFQ